MAEPLLSVDRVSLSLRRPAGGECRLADRSGRTHHRADRPERRGQDDAVCDHLRFPAAERRRRALSGGEDITGVPPHRLARRGIARTFQIVQPFAGLTVRENIAVGAHLRHASRAEALAAADIVGCEVGLGDMLDQPAATLTVAGRKRLELARALATEPKLLLLDEVLAGLNPTEIRDIVPMIRGLCDARHQHPDDRARDAGGDESVAARLCAGGRPHHCRGHAGRSSRRSAR